MKNVHDNRKIEHDWTAVKSSEILRNACYRILNQFTILIISLAIRGSSLKNQLLRQCPKVTQNTEFTCITVQTQAQIE